MGESISYPRLPNMAPVKQAAQPQTQQEDTETAELKKAFRQDRATEERPTPAEYAQPPPG